MTAIFVPVSHGFAGSGVSSIARKRVLKPKDVKGVQQDLQELVLCSLKKMYDGTFRVGLANRENVSSLSLTIRYNAEHLG